MALVTDRRTLLQSAAVAALALPLAALEAEQAAAAGNQGSLPRTADAVVIGGGLAGLIAARDLALSGRSVVLVEARDRVGGRVLNHRLRTGGATIEAGGAFVGPTQDHVLRLAKQMGVPTFREYTAGSSVSISPTLGRLEFEGTVPPDPTVAEALALIPLLDQWAAEVPVDAPWAHPRAREWDAMTLADLVRQRAPLNTAGVLNIIEAWTHPGFGAAPRQLSLLYVLWYIACSGNERTVGTFERNADTIDGAQERRFIGGSQLLPLRLARSLGDIVHLSAPVSRVEQSGGRVRVRTARGTVTARHVVVAVPPPLALRIEWAPGLPTRRRELLRRSQMGQLMKCDAVYRTPFWRAKGYNGYGLNHQGAARTVFDNTPANGGPGVLLAFVGGDTFRQYARLPLAQRRTAVLRGFADLFGEEALRPVEYTEHDWTLERWSGGGPTAINGPGVLTTYGSAIRQPFGRVHWAGTETSTYWTGYMDGALRSGKRAALEVVGAGR